MTRLLIVAFVLAACTGQPPVTSPAQPTPTASSAPTSCCTPNPSEAYRELPGPGAELAPGRYYVPDIGVAESVGFAVGDGWTTVQQLRGFFDIQDDPGSVDVIAVQFTRATGYETAQAVAAAVASRANLAVGERETVTIGGQTGIRLVVDTTDPADSQPVIFRPVLDAPPGPISIGSGRRLEVNLFTISDGVLAILVGGSITRWDRALELSRPVLESVIVSV